MFIGILTKVPEMKFGFAYLPDLVVKYGVFLRLLWILQGRKMRYTADQIEDRVVNRNASESR